MILALTVLPRAVGAGDEDDEPFLLGDPVAAAPDVLDREAVDLAHDDGRLRLLRLDHASDRDRSLGPARLADEQRQPTILAEVGVRPLALRADDVFLGVLADPLADRVLRDPGLEDAPRQVEDAGAADLPGEVARSRGRARAAARRRSPGRLRMTVFLPSVMMSGSGITNRSWLTWTGRQLLPGAGEKGLVCFHRRASAPRRTPQKACRCAQASPGARRYGSTFGEILFRDDVGRLGADRVILREERDPDPGALEQSHVDLRVPDGGGVAPAGSPTGPGPGARTPSLSLDRHPDDPFSREPPVGDRPGTRWRGRTGSPSSRPIRSGQRSMPPLMIAVTIPASWRPWNSSAAPGHQRDGRRGSSPARRW